MTKTIIVAGEDVHAFLSERYRDWDTQTPVTTIEAMWDGLGNGTLSAESEIVIFSDHFRDPNNVGEDLELAIATLAPNALVMVLSYDESARGIIDSRVEMISRREGMDQGKVYFVNVATPEDDIDAAIAAYVASHSEAEEISANVPNSAVAPKQNASPRDAREGMIICSTSSKGGSGKSSTALLLASTISKSSQKSFAEGKAKRPLDVVVVDMDIRDGQIGFLIGQMQPTALNIRIEPEWTQEVIRKNLVHASRLGIHALLAPKRPRTAEDTPPEFYRAVIEELRHMFDVVILDTSVNYTDPLLEFVCYPMADVILFVTDLGISSIFGMSRWFQETTSSADKGGMGLNKENIGIVVNKSMAGIHMDKNRVTQASNDAPILVAVPSHPAEFMQAANTNRLDLLLDHPEIGSVFFRLAKKIIRDLYPLTSIVDPATSSPLTATPTAAPVATNAAGTVKRPAVAVPTGSTAYPGYNPAPGKKKSGGLFKRQ